MRILMLGWEFPPFIAGGLGTACYGLTKALDALGHEVLFVLPKPVDRSLASHVRLMSPASPVPPGAAATETVIDTAGEPIETTTQTVFKHASFRGVTASFTSPYPSFTPEPAAELTEEQRLQVEAVQKEIEAMRAAGVDLSHEELSGYVRPAGGGQQTDYGGDLIGDAERYARLVVALTRGEAFDVIHAHDWLTYPAGLAVARLNGKPLVVHVHSTEFDRSGESVNQHVYDIERRGMHGALRVLAVSMLTKSACVRRYGVPPGKVDVIYNGIDPESSAQPEQELRIRSKDKIVLFLGRITMQKGPEYFIAAAKKVLEKIEHVKFLVAGSGDMAVGMIEQAAAAGIGHKILFTGFLRGRDVDRVFRMADCYVMPSVSEPFGLAPLEAIRNDVPVIISKQSGVSEVLTHALKVDFWDIDEMANKIIAVLRHPPLSQTLREHGPFELRRLTWEGAAERCVQAYAKVIETQHHGL